MEIGGGFYRFFLSGLKDRVGAFLEADFFGKLPDQVSDLGTPRGRTVRGRWKEAPGFGCYDPDLVHFTCCSTRIPDDAGNLAELDLLIGVEDILSS